MKRIAFTSRQYRGFIACILLAGLVPFPTRTVPEWRVRYVDAKGRPFVSLPVQQTWQNYSIESTANYLSRETDAQGYVAFPAHDAWSPLLIRLVRPIGNVFSTGVHASFGPSSWLVTRCNVFETGDTGAVYTGEDLPSQVVLTYFDRSLPNMPGSLPTPPQCATIDAQAKSAGP